LLQLALHFATDVQKKHAAAAALGLLSAAQLLRMPQVKIQDGVGLLDAEFNGSFVLQCISCQHKRLLALGPHSISFPHCTMCGFGDCLLRQRVGVVFVNVIDRGSVIVSAACSASNSITFSTVLPDSDAVWSPLLPARAHRRLFAV
jgi:hypothetical protein